jgi:hypothetical protein
MTEIAPILELHTAPWTATYTLRPEKLQIRAAIKKYGILSPVVIQAGTNLIIDGKTRCEIALDLGLTHVPVVAVECTEVEAMVLHVRLNRYRGETVARRLASIIRRVLVSGTYDEEALRNEFSMSHDEFDVLADGTVLKRRNIAAHEYSMSWVPYESDTGEDIRIERPTGLPEQVD